MMLQGRGGEERFYSSIWDACRKIHQFEGVGGFFKGMIPTYLKVVTHLSSLPHDQRHDTNNDQRHDQLARAAMNNCGATQVVPSVAISFGTYELCKRVGGE